MASQFRQSENIRVVERDGGRSLALTYAHTDMHIYILIQTHIVHMYPDELSLCPGLLSLFPLREARIACRLPLPSPFSILASHTSGFHTAVRLNSKVPRILKRWPAGEHLHLCISVWLQQ